MDVKDFETGATYRVKTADCEAPDGQIAPGKELVRRVLEPANQANSEFEDGPAPSHVIEKWQKFLRVEDVGSGKVHLLDPITVESAQLIPWQDIGSRDYD